MSRWFYPMTGGLIAQKRILRGAACFVFFSALVAPMASASPIISINPSQNPVGLGSTFTVDVMIADVTDLYAYQFDVVFDSAQFSATGVTEGGFLPSAGATVFGDGAIDNISGRISLNFATLVGLVPGASGSGSLLTVGFVASGLGTGTIGTAFDASAGDGLF